ncbi:MULTISPECIES: pyridoxal-phosphate dependent enzyme [unclassified Microbulbifer]|uniref:1-aminocyclopropane-1-carboxylate deaminase/D-cysteine desulfhydrase n=1 Tax=unclassified Microbulbifer TaxID=2619833 RepID=UPI0027E3E495|nr:MULTISPECIES: pyridoxal-phosphate dependent enzyme [unclassified Microbulbifer]
MSPRYLSSLDLHDFTQAAREVPYQRIESDLFPGVEVWIRRDDLLDPIISGNKAYKLLFNLLEAREQGVDTLITCGGAWSNHIHAAAAAGARFGFQSIGIIRGDRPPTLSATLQDVERFGMQLLFVSRQVYKKRSYSGFLLELKIAANCSSFIPEGGANLAGAKGAQLLGKIIEETKPIRFDQLWIACGTGLTLAGLRSSIKCAPVRGVEVLKAGDSIRYQAQHWLAALQNPSPACGGGVGEGENEPNPSSCYHCGGYAKYPHYLRDFQQTFEQETGIPLDPVYTAKLLYGLHREATLARIPAGAKILVLHSGGLQGRRGFLLE